MTHSTAHLSKAARPEPVSLGEPMTPSEARSRPDAVALELALREFAKMRRTGGLGMLFQLGRAKASRDAVKRAFERDDLAGLVNMCVEGFDLASHRAIWSSSAVEKLGGPKPSRGEEFVANLTTYAIDNGKFDWAQVAIGLGVGPCGEPGLDPENPRDEINPAARASVLDREKAVRFALELNPDWLFELTPAFAFHHKGRVIKSGLDALGLAALLGHYRLTPMLAERVGIELGGALDAAARQSLSIAHALASDMERNKVNPGLLETCAKSFEPYVRKKSLVPCFLDEGWLGEPRTPAPQLLAWEPKRRGPPQLIEKSESVPSGWARAIEEVEQRLVEKIESLSKEVQFLRKSNEKLRHEVNENAERAAEAFAEMAREKANDAAKGEVEASRASLESRLVGRRRG